MTQKRVLIPGKFRDPAAPKVGRPSKDEIRTRQVQTILDAVASGRTLEEVCKAADMPRPHQFRAWVRTDPELKRQWQLARWEQAHSLFDQMADLAAELATHEFGREDSAAVNARKAAIDALKHITARLKPEDYAEQKPGQQTVQVTVITPLALRGDAEAPIDTAFRVTGVVPESSKE